MFFPAELEHLLSERGFKVAGMFDNKELQETELSGSRLYVPAIFQPGMGDGIDRGPGDVIHEVYLFSRPR